MQVIPESTKFFIEKNFYNDVNGNPRIFFELYDSEMKYLGYCQDNYSGQNFLSNRNIRKVGSTVFSRGGYRNYVKTLKNDIEFKNQGLKV